MAAQHLLPRRHRFLSHRRAAGLGRVLIAVLLFLPLAGATSIAAPPAGDDDVPWKDRFGNPLPFQSHAEIVEFMRTAEIQSVEDLEVGITDPRRVELVKDGVTMRAALRDFDKTYELMRFEREFYDRLRDSYTFDLAAYELSALLGLNNIPPVTLRTVNGVEATLQIWVEDAMVEWDRFEQKIMPPDEMRFHMQRQNMLVFDSLIGNVDRNNGNVLYDEAWNHWLIDHSRSFLRNDAKMPYLDDIQWCARSLYDGLKALDRDDMATLLSPTLTSPEIDWMLKRRDKVIARLDGLIEERGEDAVLF